MTSNQSQLALLSDHIKLSLLERQRALSLNLDTDAQNAEISRSLDAFSTSLQTLEEQNAQEHIDTLRQQYTELKDLFDGAKSSASLSETRPNNSMLAQDFAAAKLTKPGPTHRSVRFTDSEDGDADQHARAALFNRPYRDDPSGTDAAYSDNPSESLDHTQLDNQQIHAYHTRVLEEQDQQLDVLGESVRRIGDLSINIGSELDEQNTMLDDLDGTVTHHQGSIDRARDRVAKIARKAKDNWSITTIAILVLILVFLLIVLK